MSLSLRGQALLSKTLIEPTTYGRPRTPRRGPVSPLRRLNPPPLVPRIRAKFARAPCWHELHLNSHPGSRGPWLLLLQSEAPFLRPNTHSYLLLDLMALRAAHPGSGRQDATRIPALQGRGRPPGCSESKTCSSRAEYFPFSFVQLQPIFSPVATERGSLKMTISSFNTLPQDLVIKLCMHVVYTSSTPHEDLRSLRTSCSKILAASKEKIIGRCMPVKKMDGFHWSDIKNYLAFLKYCAESGNLEASYLFGLQEMYTSKDKKIRNSGLNHLLNAMEGGHKASTYVAGIVLFKKPETRSLGTSILNKLAAMGLSESSSSSTAESESVMSGGNLLIQTCRREAAATIYTKYKLEEVALAIQIADVCKSHVWIRSEGSCRD
ncbi:hypothetical protein Cni_G14752 [Canna indica]|uniref:At2g35280-like TPR domain-containing protein n=1 Tax=Canna indica TaxID=4628 RepID=A0AAQ3KEV1_9LILI|nr:hypothetical protein Cni_G14752 [Canna indica]